MFGSTALMHLKDSFKLFSTNSFVDNFITCIANFKWPVLHITLFLSYPFMSLFCIFGFRTFDFLGGDFIEL